MLELLPCLDSNDMAESRKRELWIPREHAARLGQSAAAAASQGYYINRGGERIDWSARVAAARQAKVSVAPDDPLPEAPDISYPKTRVQVVNETTLQAARRLTEARLRPLALNFANGVHPGGGFRRGARAQEEVLCRSSALFETLVGDPMYEADRKSVV
jgi:uncharacterized protein (TIGR02452 family)